MSNEKNKSIIQQSDTSRLRKPLKGESVSISETITTNPNTKPQKTQTSKVPNKSKKRFRGHTFYKGTRNDYIFLPAELRALAARALSTTLIKGELRKHFTDAEFAGLLSLNSAIWKNSSQN